MRLKIEQFVLEGISVRTYMYVAKYYYYITIVLFLCIRAAVVYLNLKKNCLPLCVAYFFEHVTLVTLAKCGQICCGSLFVDGSCSAACFFLLQFVHLISWWYGLKQRVAALPFLQWFQSLSSGVTSWFIF